MATNLSSLYPKNGMVATAGLGGALSGISLAQALADAKRSDRDSDLEDLKRRFEYSEMEKDAPVKAIERQVKTNQGNLTNDLFAQGLPQELAREGTGLQIDEAKEARKRAAAADLIKTASKWESINPDEVSSLGYKESWDEDIGRLASMGVKIPKDAPPKVQYDMMQRHKMGAIADIQSSQKRGLAAQNFGFESSLQQNRITSAEKIAGDRNANDLQVAGINANTSRANATAAREAALGSLSNTGNPIDAKERMIIAQGEKGLPLDERHISYALEVAENKAATNKNVQNRIAQEEIAIRGDMNNKDALAKRAKELGLSSDPKHPPSWEVIAAANRRKIENEAVKKYLIPLVKSSKLTDAAQEELKASLESLSPKQAQQAAPTTPKPPPITPEEKAGPVRPLYKLKGKEEWYWSDGTTRNTDKNAVQVPASGQIRYGLGQQ